MAYYSVYEPYAEQRSVLRRRSSWASASSRGSAVSMVSQEEEEHSLYGDVLVVRRKTSRGRRISRLIFLFFTREHWNRSRRISDADAESHEFESLCPQSGAAILEAHRRQQQQAKQMQTTTTTMRDLEQQRPQTAYKRRSSFVTMLGCWQEKDEERPEMEEEFVMGKPERMSVLGALSLYSSTPFANSVVNV